MERGIADRGNAVGYVNACKFIAILERAFTDRGDAVSYGNACKRAATSEC